ncbi:hypothetical protein D1872_231920 [compost metagenome]
MIPDARIVDKRKSHVSPLQLFLCNQRILGALEVPVLVEHPKDRAAGNFRHVLVEVLGKRLFVDQTELIHIVQLLVVLFGIVLVCKNLRFPVLDDHAAIVRMTD